MFIIEDWCVKTIQSSTLKLIVSVIGGTATFFLGASNIHGFLMLILLCFFDFITALFVLHKHNRRFNSADLPRKIVHLFFYFVFVSCMNFLSQTSPYFGTFLTDTMIIWFSCSEALSILEHASELGYKIPVPILKNISKIKLQSK